MIGYEAAARIGSALFDAEIARLFRPTGLASPIGAALAGSRLVDLAVDFRIRFPDSEAGRAAEAVLVRAITASHDRICTVTRTVEVASPVTARLHGEHIAGPA